jgi:phosphomevalonate kinase
MRDLIAISGKQLSGKDLFTEFLMVELPGYRKIPLARAIKIEFANLYGLTPDDIEENKATYRAGLITLGQRRRQKDPDYWLHLVMADPVPKIVSDVRLKREYEFLKQHGAFMIRLEADRDVRDERGLLQHEADATETELDDVTDWNVVVVNNGSKEDLRQKAREVAEKIKAAQPA